MKVKIINIKSNPSQNRISKLSSLIDLLHQTDIYVEPIDETSLDVLYEAQTLLNNVILEANLILDEIEPKLTIKQIKGIYNED